MSKGGKVNTQCMKKHQVNDFSGVWIARLGGLGLTPQVTGCHQTLQTERDTDDTGRR